MPGEHYGQLVVYYRVDRPGAAQNRAARDSSIVPHPDRSPAGSGRGSLTAGERKICPALGL